MHEKDIDVLCVGIAVADVMGKAIDEIPDWGRLGVFGHVEHHTGGCALNTGVDLARLGKHVTVSACVGRDGAGLFIRNALEREGVDVSGLVESDEAATSYTFVMIGSDGRRRYLHHVGANAVFTDSDVPDSLLQRARILHMGGTFLMPSMDGEPTARLLRRAREMGVTTSMDTAFNPGVDARGLVEPCLRHLDIFIPSIEEGELILGTDDPDAILDQLSSYGISVAGVKLGEEGCLLEADGERQRFAPYHVDVVDTSGAGDAFMAGFLYATLDGLAIADRARFGNATAAHCIQAIGCSAGVPKAEDIHAFIER